MLQVCRWKAFRIPRWSGGFQQPVEPHRHGTWDRETQVLHCISYVIYIYLHKRHKNRKHCHLKRCEWWGVLIAHNSIVQALTPTEDLCCMSCLYFLACFQSNSTLSRLIKMKSANNNTVMYVLKICIKGLSTAGINLIIHVFLQLWCGSISPD